MKFVVLSWGGGEGEEVGEREKCSVIEYIGSWLLSILRL